jgi:hypothetical protein
LSTEREQVISFSWREPRLGQSAPITNHLVSQDPGGWGGTFWECGGRVTPFVPPFCTTAREFGKPVITYFPRRADLCVWVPAGKTEHKIHGARQRTNVLYLPNYKMYLYEQHRKQPSSCPLMGTDPFPLSAFHIFPFFPQDIFVYSHNLFSLFPWSCVLTLVYSVTAGQRT